MTKKIVSHVCVGIAIGFIATVICLWCFRLDKAAGAEVMRHFTVWLIASALYGFVSVIYDTKIPFPASCIVHFITCALITFLASLATNLLTIFTWYEWFIHILPLFVIIYIVIGAVLTIITRAEAKKINERMQRKN